jgi:hypothetical protein
MDFLNASRQMLKDYCAQNNINPEGDKRKAATWREAAIAFFKSTELSLKELFDKADEIGTKYQDPEHVKAVGAELAQIAQEVLGKAVETTAAIAVQTIETVTSDKAIEFYQRAAYLMALAVVLVVITVVTIGRAILEHEQTQAAIGTVKVRSAEFGEWVRWSIDREYQSIVNLARFAHLDFME